MSPDEIKKARELSNRVKDLGKFATPKPKPEPVKQNKDLSFTKKFTGIKQPEPKKKELIGEYVLKYKDKPIVDSPEDIVNKINKSTTKISADLIDGGVTPNDVIEELKKNKSIDISHIRNGENLARIAQKGVSMGDMRWHGAGDTVEAGTNITITDVNGKKRISASGGSSLTLETNGIPNGSQTLLNLVAGTNVTLTDDGLGGITIDSSGGGATTWGSITGTLSSQTDLQSALDALVPYTGGTTNVDLGVHNLTVDTSTLFVDSTNHRVGIGTITPGTALDIVGTSIRQSSSVVDATNKAFRFLTRNYTNAQNDFLMVFGQSKSTGNTLLFGGGQTGSTTASAISFFTGTGNNTDTGTSRMTIDSSGNVSIAGLTTSQLIATDSSKNLVSLSTATYPSLTELSYVKGVTSAIQTQIDAKGAGTVTSVTSANGDATVATTTTTPVITIVSAPKLTTARTIGTLTGDGTAAGSSFDGTANNTNALTLATVNSNVGSFGSATQVATFTVNAKGLTTAASNVTITPAVGSITGLGTGVATWLATPSSANLATAVTDETGSGALVFGTSPTLTTPTIITGIIDSNGNSILEFGAISSAVNPLLIRNGASTNGPQILSKSTNTDLFIMSNGTGKVNISQGDSAKGVYFSTSGVSAFSPMTLTFVQTAPRTITFPDATDTLVGKATTDALTNKTYNGLTLTTTTGTFTLTNAKTLSVTNTLTLSGTDSTTMTFPTTTATIARTDAAQTFTGAQTFTQVLTTNNAITASSNAATIPVTSRINTVTNNSAATLTITFTTSGAVDGQLVLVRIYDFSAATQTLTLVNTENSTITPPATTNGSTTLPLTLALQFNNATTKWRVIASA